MKKYKIKGIRKWSAVLFLLGSVLFTACGQKASEPSIQESVSQSENTESTNTNTTDTSSVSGTETSTDSGETISGESGSDSEQKIENEKESLYSWTSKQYFVDWSEYEETFRAEVEQIHLVEAEKYPQLQSALDELNQSQYQRTESLYHDNLETARMLHTENGITYSYILDMIPQRLDSQIASLMVTEYSYLGGAHPNMNFVGYNYNPQTGEAYQLKDITDNYDELYLFVTDELEKQRWNNEFDAFFPEYQDTVQKMFYGDSNADSEVGAEANVQWTMDDQGITIYFNPYDIAPYAAGRFEVRVDFASHPELFREEFLSNKKGSVSYLGSGNTVVRDINGDGSEDTVSFSAVPTEDGFAMQTQITINEVTYEHELDGFSAEAYLFCTEDNRAYLYVETSHDSDYQMLSVFDLNEQVPKYVGRTEESFYGLNPMRPDSFLLADRLYVLGTYQAYRNFQIGEDGMPVTDDAVYQLYTNIGVEGYSDYVLTTKKEIPVWVYQTEGEGEIVSETKERQVLPVGTKLRIVATDVVSFVEVEMEDGQRGELQIERSEENGWYMIEGVSEYDCFEEVLYAG